MNPEFQIHASKKAGQGGHCSVGNMLNLRRLQSSENSVQGNAGQNKVAQHQEQGQVPPDVTQQENNQC